MVNARRTKEKTTKLREWELKWRVKEKEPQFIFRNFSPWFKFKSSQTGNTLKANTNIEFQNKTKQEHHHQ